MERRSFLRALGLGLVGAVAGAEFDIERALWVPGQKVIVDLGTAPPMPGSFNTLVTPEWVIHEMTTRVANHLRMAEALNKQYEQEFASRFYGVPGDAPTVTVTARLPQRYRQS